jgi:hypothetical protein
MRLVREILGRSPAYQALGARIAGFVSARGFGGAEPCPQHLVVREHPAGEEVCAACGEVLDGGTFELRNIHTGHEMHLPYLALHALMSHGEAFYEGGRGRGVGGCAGAAAPDQTDMADGSASARRLSDARRRRSPEAEGLCRCRGAAGEFGPDGSMK